MKRSLPFLLLLFLFTIACKKPGSLMHQLRDNNKVGSSYYCYPSTLRMLNFGNLTSLNKLVKDVEKVSILMMDQDSFDYKQMQTLYSDLQEKEAYELYLEIEDTERQIYILGKESPQKAVFLINQDDRRYVLDITGRPDFMQITKAMDEIKSIDSTDVSGYSMLLDLVDQDAKNLERRRERRRKWEEEKRKREAEEAGLLPDTTAIQKDSIPLD